MGGSLGDAIGLIAAVGALTGAIVRYYTVLVRAPDPLEIERATAIGFFIGLLAAIPVAAVTVA